jgi:hypothetical protein
MFVSPTISPDYQTPSPMLQGDALKIFQAREPRSLKEKQTKKKPTSTEGKWVERHIVLD